MTLLALLDQVREELPGCELTSVVSLATGLSLAASRTEATMYAEAVDAFSGEIYRIMSETLADAGLDGPVHDVVLQSDARILISTLLGDTGYFWHISTEPQTTLGFTQAVMRKYESQVAEGVTELVG